MGLTDQKEPNASIFPEFSQAALLSPLTIPPAILLGPCLQSHRGPRRREGGALDLLAPCSPTYPSREREIQTKAHSHRQPFQEKPTSRDAGTGVNKEKMQNSKRKGPKNISPAECAMKRRGQRGGQKGTPGTRSQWGSWPPVTTNFPGQNLTFSDPGGAPLLAKG